jgi:hypothetical protein
MKLSEEDDFLLHLTSPYRVYYDALSFHAVALLVNSKVCQWYCSGRSVKPLDPIQKWVEFEAMLCHYRLMHSAHDRCSFLFGKDVKVLNRKQIKAISYQLHKKKYCSVAIFDLSFENDEYK